MLNQENYSGVQKQFPSTHQFSRRDEMYIKLKKTARNYLRNTVIFGE